MVAVSLLYLDDYDPMIRENAGVSGIGKSQLWAATTALLAMLLGFRTNKAFARFWEGTGLLHQMRGEWFDTVSNCVTFSIASKAAKQSEVMAFRHTIVRLMSLCHGSALEEIAQGHLTLDTIDTIGLDDQTLNHLNDCSKNYGFNKVEVMLHLLQSMIVKALEDGILNIPAPICSRVFQTISRGFVNLLNAKKITDTSFPFPYAQLIAMLLFINIIFVPLHISVLVKSKVLAAMLSFVPIWGMVCANFIASELEDPFGSDSNDLPLEHFQAEMNTCLLMLLHPNADLIPGVCQRCETDFHALLKVHRQSVSHDGEHIEEDDEENIGDDTTDSPVEPVGMRRSGTLRLSQFNSALHGEGPRMREIADPKAAFVNASSPAPFEQVIVPSTSSRASLASASNDSLGSTGIPDALRALDARVASKGSECAGPVLKKAGDGSADSPQAAPNLGIPGDGNDAEVWIQRARTLLDQLIQPGLQEGVNRALAELVEHQATSGRRPPGFRQSAPDISQEMPLLSKYGFWVVPENPSVKQLVTPRSMLKDCEQKAAEQQRIRSNLKSNIR